MDDIYENIEEYSRNKKRQILILFDDIMAEILSNKRLIEIVTELFIRRKLLNILLFQKIID